MPFSSRVVLDIAIAFDYNSVPEYSNLQSLFGLMYRLICIICTERQIDVQYGNDVDTRLVLFHRVSGRDRGMSNDELSDKFEHMSLIDLETLSKTARAWQCICSLESEDGEEILQEFLQYRRDFNQRRVADLRVERLPGGLTIRQKPSARLIPHSRGFSYHRAVAVGGTFDHLHAGHKLLLTMAALILEPEATGNECLTVGITGDDLLKNKQYREEVEDFLTRQSRVQQFLLGILELISPTHVQTSSTFHPGPNQGPGRQVLNELASGLIIKYVEIFDPCGPTITDEAISALVLSAETSNGGRVVNEKRAERGWSALEVFEVGVLDAGDSETSSVDVKFQNKISSTDIRRRLHQKLSNAEGNP